MARYDRIYLSNFRNAFPEKGHARISSSSSYICHLKLKLFLPLVQWCIIGLSIEKFVLIQPDLTALPLWACFNVASSVKFKLFFVAPTHSSSVWRSFSLLVHPVSWAFFFSSVFGKHFTHVGVHGFSYRIAFRTLLTAILSISRPLLPASRQRKMPPHLQGVRKETLCLAQDGLACVNFSHRYAGDTVSTVILRTCFYPPTHNAVNFLIVFTGREKIAPLVQITPRLFRTFS